MTKIAHILGDWSRNIGNAFFQLGGHWALQHAIPDAQIMLINEQPGYPSYWNPKGGSPTNSFNLPENIEVDYLVLMGPIFRAETRKIWENALLKIRAKGTRLIFLGIGSMKSNKNYEEDHLNFIKNIKPYIFISRDRDTFRKFSEYSTHAYDGIDFGFFMPEVYKPVGLYTNNQKILALNFDKIPEPEIVITKGNYEHARAEGFFHRSFEFADMQWSVRFPEFRTRFSEYSRYTMFLEGVIFPGNGIDKIGEYTIIRPEHRPHPLVARKTFRYPNVIVNDTPYIYTEIYHQAELTLSTRVHACVLALAYGRSAMLFSRTPRARLLNRLGLDEAIEKPVTLNSKLLADEKNKIIKFLKTCF